MLDLTVSCKGMFIIVIKFSVEKIGIGKLNDHIFSTCKTITEQFSRKISWYHSVQLLNRTKNRYLDYKLMPEPPYNITYMYI